jgi:hypothetical protein
MPKRERNGRDQAGSRCSTIEGEPAQVKTMRSLRSVPGQ